MAESDTEKKVNAAGIAAVVAALAAGGGGVGLLTGSAELSREIEKLQSQIADIRDAQAAEELRAVAMVSDTDDGAAARTRRVRDELHAKFDELREKVQAMELELARRH